MTKQKTYPVSYGAQVVVQEPPILGKIVVTVFAGTNKVHFDLEDMRSALNEISNNDSRKGRQADNIAVDPTPLAEGTLLGGPSGGGASPPASDISRSYIGYELLPKIPVDSGRDAPDPWERLQGGDIG